MISPRLLKKVIRVLFGLSEDEESFLQEQEQFFRAEIVKAYDAHDYHRVEFLTQLKEKVNGLG